MRQSEIDLLNAYFYNNYVRLESNIHTLKNNIRFRNIDQTDCIELMLAIQEFDTFKEIMKHIKLLLKLNKNESECDIYEDSEK
jgi:hypothetical protein